MQKKDRTGERFGKLTVIKKDPENTNKYICQCDCGNIISVYQGHLVQGNTTSCHQGVCNFKDLDSIVGKKFGKLTVIKRDLTKLNGSY